MSNQSQQEQRERRALLAEAQAAAAVLRTGTRVIAEFRDGAEAFRFARLQGLERHVVTAGHHLAFAVRERHT